MFEYHSIHVLRLTIKIKYNLRYSNACAALKIVALAASNILISPQQVNRYQSAKKNGVVFDWTSRLDTSYSQRLNSRKPLGTNRCGWRCLIEM